MKKYSRRNLLKNTTRIMILVHDNQRITLLKISENQKEFFFFFSAADLHVCEYLCIWFCVFVHAFLCLYLPIPICACVLTHMYLRRCLCLLLMFWLFVEWATLSTTEINKKKTRNENWKKKDKKSVVYLIRWNLDRCSKKKNKIRLIDRCRKRM